MQTSFSTNPKVGFAGMLADAGLGDIVSRINSAKQLFSVVVTTVENSADFVVTIDGTAYTFTSDGSATKAEIAAGLKALVDAGSDDVTTELFTTAAANDSFYIENNSIEEADELTVTITNPSSGVLTLAEVIDHNDVIQFGAVVVEDERASVDGLTYKADACRLPRLATDFSNRLVLGVALADISREVRSTSPYGGYDFGEAVGILRKGRIWMAVEDPSSVAPGGLVYVRHVASASESLGAIRAADDGSDTEVLDAQQARFTGQVDTTNAIAVVEWNLP
jgi:hypothetical protein